MIKTDTEKLTVEMEGNLADYMMDFVLIVEGIKEEVLREDLRHMKEIATEIRDDGMTAAVGPTTDYSPYVEYGTRFMQAEPFVKPSWEEQKELFKKDMDKLVK